MKQHAGSARSVRVAVRLTREEQHQVDEAAKVKGYANSSAFIRAAIRNELDGRAELDRHGRERSVPALIAFRRISSALAGDSRRSLRWWTLSPKRC